MKPSLSLALLSVLSLGHAYLPVPYSNPSSVGTPPQRMDIDTLSSQQLTLFVLAMQNWQTMPAGNVGGYFQVVGIHGAPHVYWDNAGGYQPTNTGDDQVGYCFHFDQNFYLWHRPYLALFEQQMRAKAIAIANTWNVTQRTQYQAAAATLRLPYWDWAKGSSPGTVSSLIASSTIQINNATSGQPMTIANPLYKHTLVAGGNLGTYDDGSAISVGPGRTTTRANTYTSDMQSQGKTLQQNTALLFNTANVCWNSFATYSNAEHKQCTGNTNVPSLESTHNTVHNTIGGTMSDLDVSAFDPIFWMHHCNVDRLGALWQAINPNTTVQATYDQGYTFVANPATRDATWPYMPFRIDSGATDWWQPQMSYDVRANNYTYPEIYDMPSPSTALGRVNAIYGTGRTQQNLKNSASRMKRGYRIARAPVTAANIVNLVTPPSTAQLAPFTSLLIARNGSFHEYSVRATVQSSVAPGTSFNLHLFFGDVAVGSDYLTAPNRVGGFSVSQAGSGHMNMTAAGIVDITDALLNMLVLGNVRDLKPATIRQYLRAKLVWRLVTVDGQDIGGAQGRANGLTINVQHTLVTPEPAANVLPVLAPAELLVDTTDNTQASALPSGVAASTLTSVVNAAAASGVGPVSIGS